MVHFQPYLETKIMPCVSEKWRALYPHSKKCWVRVRPLYPPHSTPMVVVVVVVRAAAVTTTTTTTTATAAETRC